MFLTKRYKYLKGIFSQPDKREALVQGGLKEHTAEENERDAQRVVRFSTSEEYAVWREEAWREAVSCIDKLTRPDLNRNESDFYRGSLSAILDMMRISDRAREGLTNALFADDEK